ncbi:MAG: HEAT repeat domain-containing protein, partial [Actinomycetota bacterium]
MSFLRTLFGPSQEEIWGQLSREIGGSLTSGAWSGMKVQAQTGDWIVTLDTYTQSTGKSSVTYTRIRAPFLNRDGLQLAIYRAGLFTELGKLFGVQDLEVGDPFFDETFVVQGNDEAKVRALFANARIRELLHAQPSIYLATKREESWLWGPKYPQGVDVLYFSVVGVIRDLAVLRTLFDLYSEVLNQLCHMDGGYHDDVNLHLRDLTSPGGQVTSENVVLWDGGPPRRRAAQALGRLKAKVAIPYLIDALRDPDPLLRANAAWALGEIGERAAAPAVLRLLADEAPSGGERVKAVAATALARCGLSELVTAFDAALRGERDGLEALRHAGRPEIRWALQQALMSELPERAAWSAWALGELGVVEAIRLIRERLKALRR